MKDIQIKICGIKTLEIAEFCIENGVNLLGFNFSPGSPRKIELQEADSIISKLKSKFPNGKTEMVALFFKTDENERNQVIRSNLFDSIQYLPYLEDLTLSGFKGKIIPQIGVERFIQDSDLKFHNELVILDSFNKNTGGGSGKVFPWEFVKDIQRKYFLAGGLNPDSIIEAVQFLSPYGVDVASGVEESPGVKNKDLIQRFIQNART